MLINECADAIHDIWRYLLLNLVPLYILAGILITIALLGLFQKAFRKIIIILMIIFALFIIAYATIEISLFSYDLNNQAFDEYQGEFSYRKVSGNEEDVLKFPDGTSIKVRSVANFDISTGEYDGSIIYGKYSKWAIKISTK